MCEKEVDIRYQMWFRMPSGVAAAQVPTPVWTLANRNASATGWLALALCESFLRKRGCGAPAGARERKVTLVGVVMLIVTVGSENRQRVRGSATVLFCFTRAGLKLNRGVRNVMLLTQALPNRFKDHGAIRERNFLDRDMAGQGMRV